MVLSVITLLSASSVVAFAAVGDEPIPEPIPYPMELPYSASMTIDSICTAGDVSLAIPKGWEASMVSDEFGEYVKIMSSNGYEIHLNVSSYGKSFDESYVNASLQTTHAPITTVAAYPIKMTDSKQTSFIVRTTDNTIYYLQYVTDGDWLPGHGEIIAEDEYFYPRFVTPRRPHSRIVWLPGAIQGL